METKSINFELSELNLKNPKISYLDSNSDNYVYLIEDGKKKYVLKLKKKDEKQFANSLEKEYIILKYFEEKKLNFISNTYYHNLENNYLIQQYLIGDEVFQKDFDDKQIDTFAKQLYKIFSLSVDDFYEFCEKNSFKKYKVQDTYENFKIYGQNRFLEVEEKIIGSKKYNWIKKKLDENMDLINKSKELKKKIGFNWGKIQNKVLIDSKNHMSFFDFEHVKISDSNELAYIKIHSDFSKKQFKKLVESYSKYSKIKIDDLYDEINFNEKIIRLNDVIWSAMKYSKNKNLKYETMLNNRIELFKKLKN